MQALCSSYHLGRQIDPANLRAAIMDITGNMARSASELAGGTGITNVGCESFEKVAVERLSGQLAGNAQHILLRDGVVRSAHIRGR